MYLCNKKWILSFNLKNFHSHSTIMIRTFILMTLFISTILSTAIQAQFNGILDIQLYIKNDVGITDTSLIHMYVTPERILMQGAEEESIKSGNYEASGLLIRQDQRDFVLMMGKNQALKLTKSEIESFFTMISTIFGIEEPTSQGLTESKSSVVITGRVENINGYPSKEIRITDADGSGYATIWTTTKLDMDWGLLKEPWLNSPNWLRDATDRATIEFQSKSVPVLMTWTSDGGTFTFYELIRAEKTAVAKAMVELPSNYQLLGFSDWIMLQMMQQY